MSLRRPDPLSAFRGRGLGTRLALAVIEGLGTRLRNFTLVWNRVVKGQSSPMFFSLVYRLQFISRRRGSGCFFGIMDTSKGTVKWFVGLVEILIFYSYFIKFNTAGDAECSTPLSRSKWPSKLASSPFSGGHGDEATPS